MSAEGQLVSFDLDRVQDVAHAAANGRVYVVSAVTTSDYRIVYVDDVVQEWFETADEALEDVADTVYTYETIDFFERDHFDDMVPSVGDVRAFTTFTERAVVVRVLTAREGVSVTVEPGTDVTALVRELEPIVTGTESP